MCVQRYPDGGSYESLNIRKIFLNMHIHIACIKLEYVVKSSILYINQAFIDNYI